MIDADVEKRRRALATLSGIGAALAGVGVGVWLSERLQPLMWLILAVGVAVHLIGMVGTHRLQNESGYAPSGLDQAAYWTCWLMIAALAVYGTLALL